MLPKLGRYETLKKIASGGMATVYLGRVVGEGGFERLVALKVMHPHIASDPDFVGMFLDEARLAALIRHPNVVATIDIQKTSEAMFIVMDYVDGPTLQEVRKHLRSRDERVPIGIALRFFIDILNGLQEAHELRDADGKPLNLVHRDVSPHNILIGQDGRAQLTDFGVAKAEARISSTRGGQLKGKIAYMPPEQIIAQPVDRRADVYSAGVCLWECLVGKRLFRAANDGALVHMILDGKPAPPSRYCDDIPAAIEGVLMKAISRRPEDRYEEAVDFAEALEDAAREAKIKLPKQREVGRFIKEIVGELGRHPVSRRSLTPPSAPSQGAGVPPLADAPKEARGGAAPSSPPAPGGAAALPQPPIQAAPELAKGPPPIPEIGSDPAIPVRLPRPKKAVPPARSSAPGAPPPVPPQKPAARVKKAADVAPLVRPPIQFDEIEDPPTEVIPAEQSMADLVNNSQPSVVTSPTKTDASYSVAPPGVLLADELDLTPPPSRHGVIAVIVAGGVLAAVIVAVLVGSPDDDTRQIIVPPSPPAANTGAASSPTPTVPAPPPSAPPPAASSANTEVQPTPAHGPNPLPGGARPTPTPPRPEPGPFKPKTL